MEQQPAPHRRPRPGDLFVRVGNCPCKGTVRWSSSDPWCSASPSLRFQPVPFGGARAASEPGRSASKIRHRPLRRSSPSHAGEHHRHGSLHRQITHRTASARCTGRPHKRRPQHPMASCTPRATHRAAPVFKPPHRFAVLSVCRCGVGRTGARRLVMPWRCCADGNVQDGGAQVLNRLNLGAC